MGFLNKEMLSKRDAIVNVEEHPLLSEISVPSNIRTLYLQGCVVGALEVVDTKELSANVLTKIEALGCSLQKSKEEIREAIEGVCGLSSEDQGAFLDELFAALSQSPYPGYFLRDFERMMVATGSVTTEARETLDLIGRSLFRSADWRQQLWQFEKDKCTLEDFKRYELAADGGDKIALRICTRAYLDGVCVDKNVERAISLLSTSADSGSVESMMELARFYQSSEREKDAEKWYQKAMSNGSSEAKSELDQIVAKQQLVIEEQKMHALQEKIARRNTRSFRRLLASQDVSDLVKLVGYGVSIAAAGFFIWFSGDYSDSFQNWINDTTIQ